MINPNKSISINHILNLDYDLIHQNNIRNNILTKLSDLYYQHKLWHYIDDLNGRQFEIFIARLLNLKMNNHNNDIYITPASNDYGIDIIDTYTVPNKYGCISIGIQCKDIQSESIGYPAVEETLAGKKFYHLNYGVVITNGTFSMNARIGAKKCGITLVDRYKLQDLVKDVLKLANFNAVSDRVGKLKLELKMIKGLEDSLNEKINQSNIPKSMLEFIDKAIILWNNQILLSAFLCCFYFIYYFTVFLLY